MSIDIKRSGPPKQIGRYVLFGQIASGGMATVHVGRRLGPAGYSRVVAMKRMHPAFAKDPDFVAAFLEEARITARVVHPHVVSSNDVVAEDDELLIVMDYIEGESLARLTRAAFAAGTPPPLPVVVAIVAHALRGLHAAHEAKDESGALLGLVHRDVSPQNILVGADGLTRVLDFGIAKMAARAQQETQSGMVKGKVPYLSPEQLRSEPLDRRTDIHAASVVLFEALVGSRLFSALADHEVFEQILSAKPRRLPSSDRADVPSPLDRVFARGAALEPAARFATALEMARALEAAVEPASPDLVAEWVARTATETMTARSKFVADAEKAGAIVIPEDDGLATEVAHVAPQPSPASNDDAARAPLEDTRPLSRAPPRAASPVVIGPAEAVQGLPIPERTPAGTGNRGVVAALAALAFVLLAAVLVFRDPEPTSSPRATETSSRAAALASAPGSIESVAIPAASSAAPIAAESVTASAAVSAPAAAPGTAPKPARCTPPYFYEGGFKRYKPGCL